MILTGLLGYPFVLPDMIGGNAYGGLPSEELFVRWTQANAFMPTLQFSLLPWQFGDTVRIDRMRNISLEILSSRELKYLLSSIMHIYMMINSSSNKDYMRKVNYVLGLIPYCKHIAGRSCCTCRVETAY